MESVLSSLKDCVNSHFYSDTFRERILAEIEKQKADGKTLESVFCSEESLKEDIINDLKILNVVLADLSDSDPDSEE